LIVVSDTSPILNLARIGRLGLLPSLYEQVLIPPAVFGELTASTSQDFPAIDTARNSWLLLGTPKDQQRVLQLRADLDAGEAEAIVLAVELQANLLLVDERAGLIESVKPLLDDLIQKARFWIGPELYREVLVELDEMAQ